MKDDGVENGGWQWGVRAWILIIPAALCLIVVCAQEPSKQGLQPRAAADVQVSLLVVMLMLIVFESLMDCGCLAWPGLASLPIRCPSAVA